MNVSLSDTQMRQALKGFNPLVISYPDLIAHCLEHGPDSILDIIDHHPICICFLTKEAYGHWIALFRNEQGVQFFDSYAIAPDDEQKWDFSQKFKNENYEWFPFLNAFLLHLCETHGLPVFFNSVPLQAHGNGVATCGRWVILRVIFNSLSDKEFPALIDKLCKRCNYSPDKLAVALTDSLITQDQ